MTDRRLLAPLFVATFAVILHPNAF